MERCLVLCMCSVKFLQADKCESVHLDVIHKGSSPQRKENEFGLGDGVANVPFFDPLSPSFLIFCQHIYEGLLVEIKRQKGR